MKNIAEILKEKTKQLEEVGQKIGQSQEELGKLQAEALKLDGAINQLKDLEK